jgi:hypothetical protein
MRRVKRLGRRSPGVALVATAALVTLPARTPATAAETPLPQGKPATSSSTENAGTPTSSAVDGDTGTRWSSAASDDQWLRVDLGTTASVTRVVLHWEAAHGKDYRIQLSQDGGSWTDARTVTGSDGGVDTVDVSGQARYVRMQGLDRATGWGYSLWEFQVFGTTGTTPPASCGTADSALGKPASAMQDVFIRVGGAAGPGRATGSVVVNSDDVLIDHTWIWRADHGEGVGRETNRADYGLRVNGDDVLTRACSSSTSPSTTWSGAENAAAPSSSRTRRPTTPRTRPPSPMTASSATPPTRSPTR